MVNEDTEFLKRIQTTFRIEAEEHLKSFSMGLIELEKNQTKESLGIVIESMFREIHSLKGAASSIGQKDIVLVCQPLESIFSGLKNKEINLKTATLDLLYRIVEHLSKLIYPEGIEHLSSERQNLMNIILQLQQLIDGAGNDNNVEALAFQSETKQADYPPVVSSEIDSSFDFQKNTRHLYSEVVRIPHSKLDPLLIQAEEFLQAKTSFNQLIDKIYEVLNEATEWKKESQKWLKHGALASIVQWTEWYVGNELQLSNMENHLTEVTHLMENDRYNFERMVNDHLDAIKQVIMLPVSSLVETFPSMVREISHEQQKEIDLFINGSELEIDKRILDELKDPLIHLIRNSIDHGIGRPRERQLRNKPIRGRIILSFTPKESGLVEISVSDDGKGVNKDQVIRSAVKLGILPIDDNNKLDDNKILSLIEKSGISTSAIITDLSGRGLGLSIVKEKVKKLNGKLTMETKEHSGTNFRILLPMTLATFRGILVSLGDFMFVLPLMNVVRVLRVKPEEITSIESHETICIDEDTLSVVSLAKTLGLPEYQNGFSHSQLTEFVSSDCLRIIVLASGEDQIAFKVDEILEEYQVLVKGLGKLLKRVRNISGATILGAGKVVPVLNVSDLIKSAAIASRIVEEKSYEKKSILKSGKILVAEDSITSRTLLKNILETAGYQVITAVDGTDAYIRAKNSDFDLIVSDVDMPRMNGFELSAKIRSDKKLGEIPIVLVTALESHEDRERGIESGANAYIVKSSFDQGNLLDVIKKLI